MKIDKKTLWAILKTESESHNCEGMAALMVDLLHKAGAQVWRDSIGNVYAVKGAADVFPCIVAHLDTVHDITGEEITPVEIGGRVMGVHASSMDQTGIGGDDKCGLYAALYCLTALPSCKVALFVDEEVGCIGSSSADMGFFDDVSFVLQADRRGGRDFVTSIGGLPLSSAEWLAAIKPLLDNHGMTCTAGAMTDVESLRDNGVGVCVANMSAGYYEPHTSGEYIHLAELSNVCALMLSICQQHGHKRWKYSPPKRKRERWGGWRKKAESLDWEPGKNSAASSTWERWGDDQQDTKQPDDWDAWPLKE